MSEPRPDDDLTASGIPAPAGDPDSTSPQSASEIVAADMAAIDATPASEGAATPARDAPATPAADAASPPMTAYTPPPESPPMTAYTPPPAAQATDWAATTPTPAPPATDWAAPAATSPTPPGGTPVQSLPQTPAWAQPPTPAYQPAPAYPPQPQAQPGWPQQPAAYQQPQAYAPPPEYPPQQPYQQPAAYPPQQTWQQPGEPSGWVQPQDQYWQGSAGVWAYKTSVLAILAGIWILLAGLGTGAIGVIFFAATSITSYLRDQGATQEVIDFFNRVAAVFGVVFLVFAVLLLLSALGIFLHKNWARVIGIIFSVLGTLLFLGLVAGGNRTTTSGGSTVTISGASFGIIFLVGWVLCLLFLIISGGHFHKRRVG